MSSSPLFNTLQLDPIIRDAIDKQCDPYIPLSITIDGTPMSVIHHRHEDGGGGDGILYIPFAFIRIEGHIFAIDDPLGMGRFGTVHSAYDLDTDTYVALKIQPSIARARVEVKAARCSQLWEHGPIRGPMEHEGLAYFTMPLATNNLCQYLKTHSDIPITLVLSILEQVERLHKAGWVHLDLKADNILMFGDQPCLSDFGSSHPVGSIIKRIEPSASCRHIAPELFAVSINVILPALDVYSIGALFYYLRHFCPILRSFIPQLRDPISTARPELNLVHRQLTASAKRWPTARRRCHDTTDTSQQES